MTLYIHHRKTGATKSGSYLLAKHVHTPSGDICEPGPIHRTTPPPPPPPLHYTTASSVGNPKRRLTPSSMQRERKGMGAALQTETLCKTLAVLTLRPCNGLSSARS